MVWIELVGDHLVLDSLLVALGRSLRCCQFHVCTLMDNREHTLSLVSLSLSPTASLPAVARVLRSTLGSLATFLLVSLEAWLVSSLALSPT